MSVELRAALEMALVRNRALEESAAVDAAQRLALADEVEKLRGAEARAAGLEAMLAEVAARPDSPLAAVAKVSEERDQAVADHDFVVKEREELAAQLDAANARVAELEKQLEAGAGDRELAAALARLDALWPLLSDDQAKRYDEQFPGSPTMLDDALKEVSVLEEMIGPDRLKELDAQPKG